MQIGDMIYYVRRRFSKYDVLDLRLRTVEENYFVGSEKDSKQAFLFRNRDINDVVFLHRKDAVKEAKEREKTMVKRVYTETEYEEYWNKVLTNGISVV